MASPQSFPSLCLRERSSRILLAWPFVLALAALLLNDIILKYEYPGWLTGKLSDFAGLFVIAGLVLIASPRRSGWMLLLSAALFAWWKSPQSQWWIDFLNGNGSGIRIGRVVDVTDLVALPALPLAAAVLRGELCKPRCKAKPIAASVSGVFVMLALMGTSALPMMQKFSVRDVDPVRQIDRAQAENIMDRVAAAYGFRRCTECVRPEWIIFQGGQGAMLEYSFLPGDRGILLLVDVGNVGLFTNRDRLQNRLNAIQLRLLQELGATFPGREFILDLAPDPEPTQARPETATP